MDFAPKDRSENMQVDLYKLLNRGSPVASIHKPIFDAYDPMKQVCINNFKINIFNTNMVINTKIYTHDKPRAYKTILDIPRLTNNFVIKKYSVKEPSFTISVFYSEDMCQGAAINVNISGGLLNFLLAMGNLKCFMPIKNILPVSIANWNSTLDLHGLENQYIVRTGRKDIFWTTNFPSAVSSKLGYNVSWFKAATATVSKVHGETLVNHIYCEALPIITNNHAKINPIKNSLFTVLETRNKAQIQALHKRFLECLFECCSFQRLNVQSLRRLSHVGIFDFSKKIISHTKNKHECAILGYRKCNLIPKVFSANKKSRLDELGRNANFMTFISHLGDHKSPVTQKIVRHVIRSFGLQWRLKGNQHRKFLLHSQPKDTVKGIC